MKEAFIKLHLSVLIAGGTGIFGRLITLNEGLLVWYRMLLAGVLFYIVLFLLKKLRKLPARDALRIASVGLLLAVHWLFFYGSIKASNVSIGVVCLSLMSFFTALFDPVINRHRVSASEILFSLVGVAGIVLIFHFDPLPCGYPYGSRVVGAGFPVYYLQQESGFGLSVGHYLAV